jgi:beta-lactam-binding protein with PASTA domain
MMRIIEVIVSPQGETKIETKGFAGSSCREASQFLEQALGTKVSEIPTAEFYQAQPQGQVIQQGGGQ